jgi:hypothetical protein
MTEVGPGQTPRSPKGSTTRAAASLLPLNAPGAEAGEETFFHVAAPERSWCTARSDAAPPGNVAHQLTGVTGRWPQVPDQALREQERLLLTANVSHPPAE